MLNLILPDIAGEEVCEEPHRISRVRVITLTGKSTVADRLQGLSLGADDYHIKPF